jgi:6-phosphofructokinase 1
MENKKSLVYFQSGGPTAVINSSLFGVVTEAKKHAKELSGIYGSMHGVEGLIKDEIIDLGLEDSKEIALLKQTPGAALGSTRTRLPAEGDPLFQKIVATIRRHNIGYILVNGGNDSMDTCARLARFFDASDTNVKVLGIPKTIDNDLLITDHSIGYPSAAKHVMNSLKMAVLDAKAYRKGKVLLVEIMGRDTGWLTAAGDLLPEGERPDLIYLPEMGFSLDQFLGEVKATYDRQGYCVAALSEGLPMAHINEGRVDSFGHQSLEGVCLALAGCISSRLGIGTRTFELSLPQRADPIFVSAVDRSEAIRIGAFAVKKLLEGETGQMVCIRRLSSSPYRAEFVLAPAEIIANKVKKIPADWLYDTRRLSDSFRQYLTPLVQGEVKVRCENGVFKTAHLRLIPVK